MTNAHTPTEQHRSIVDLDQKIILEGTHRARTPEETWSLLEPMLSRYGVTRVADVTDLDCIGIPVYVAVRPMSETLAVSQGKGATAALAKISAAMESIELHHAERPGVPVITGGIKVTDGHYPIEALNPRVDRALLEGMHLEWYVGKGGLTGDPIPVPANMVRNSYATGNDWKPNIFDVSSNGLASGNTYAEAALHALYEVIERDAISTLSPGAGGQRQYLDPTTVPGRHCSEFVRKLSAAGVELEVSMIPNRFGVAAAAAFIWSHEYPSVCAGSGAHSDPIVAVSRAISEAVQSRLTHISGTRDDIESDLDSFEVQRDNPKLHTGGAHWDDATAGMGFAESSLTTELERVCLTVHEVTGFEPVIVDISTEPDSFRVVKVVCPGLGHLNRGHVPR